MNAVLKPEKIETIFDHGATEDELNSLFFGQPEPEIEYLLGLSQESCLVDIVRLYRLRKDAVMAEKYLEMIGDAKIKLEFHTKGCCVGHS